MGARRFGLTVTVVICVLVGGLVFTGVSALAAFTYPFDGQLAPTSGSFGSMSANSVTVDDFNSETYVADDTGVVDVFDSTGTQLSTLDGSTTPAGSFGSGGSQIMVAANNGTGELYVLDSLHNVVDAFDSAGNYVCQVTGSSTPSASECNGPVGSDTPAHGFSTPLGIAVDQATGELYVLDAKHAAIDIFSPAGAYQRQVSLALIPGGFSEYTRGIAVSGFNAHVYAVDAFKGVYEFDAAGSYVTTWTGSNTPTGSFSESESSVAVDDLSGDVYISDLGNKVTDVFDSAGAYLTRFSHFYEYPAGTAVDQASGKIYVSDNASAPTPQVVDIFGPGTVIPDVVTSEATEVEPASATLNGTVDPDGLGTTDCHFDYGTNTSYGQTAPCVESIGSGTSAVSVHANVSLQAGVTYHFRLEASNNKGTSFGEDATLATPPPPRIESASATSVTASSAELDAIINPSGFTTTYRFEWGTSMAYGTSTPVPDGHLEAGASGVPIATDLSGLSTGITYHWRVIATNVNGTTVSPDHTFVYDTSGGGLPDNRAYEMVTPPGKDGALIGNILFGPKPDVSEDGSRLIASSIQCFGGAESCTASRETEGEQFLFKRSAEGWRTTALAPPATQFETNSSWLVSADAGTELFSMPVPPMNEDDFYVREPSGSFVAIGPATPPASGAQGEVWGSRTMGATTDFSHIFYQEEPSWPFDGGNEHSLYEYVGTGNNAPILVAVSGGAGSTDLISKCGSVAGASSNSVLPGTMSANGRVLYFTALACASGTGVNSSTPVPANAVYARIDQARTVKISERSPTSCTSVACQSSPAATARFEGASQDGSRAFFMSTQQLTDEASEDGHVAKGQGCAEISEENGCNLYEYDFADPAGPSLVDASAGDVSGHGPRVQGVMGISSDGSHIYFVAKGVLSITPNNQGEAAKDGKNNVYVFERDAQHPKGQITFVATLPDSDIADWKELEGEVNVTPDGRFLVFVSTGDLTPDDTSRDGAQQVFRYDALTGELLRISVGNDGFNDNGNRSVRVPCETAFRCTSNAKIVPAELGFLSAGPGRSDPTMSHDGAYVFFESPAGLTPQALDYVQIGTLETGPQYAENVYEWHDGHVYLISDGRDTAKVGIGSAVGLLGSDATGANVFFSTADKLVSRDTDTQLDYYDARICTAEERCIEPPPPPLPPCAGEACHGIPATQPLLPNSPTVTFNGQGNVLGSPAKTGPRKVVRKARKKVVKKVAVCHKAKRRGHVKCPKAQSKHRPTAMKAKAHKGGK
jgi:hypothetical protein